MSNLVDQQWSEHVRELRAALQTGEWAAAREHAEALEAAYQADGLPADLRELWQQHRGAVNQAITQGEAAADDVATLAEAGEARANWEEKLQRLQAMLAHIPAAARHQVQVGRELFEEIDAAAQAGELPDDLAAIWAQHRATAVQAGQAATVFADEWDERFPVFADRLKEIS
ncbi:MAG: hypothetical protein ACTSPX_01100 [Candidatus Thorarchaeota archaeon]